MVEFDLNLSTRPFPAYRLTNVVLVVVAVVLAVLSAWQVYGFLHYSSLATGIRQSERSARVESEALGRQLATLEAQLNTPAAAAKLSEIDYLNNLITRKGFSWTQVFANLETLVPETVHLTSLRPEIPAQGPIVMHLDVIGKNIDAISDFINALEQSPAFENVIVSVEEKRDLAATSDVAVAMTVNYYPDKEAQ